MKAELIHFNRKTSHTPRQSIRLCLFLAAAALAWTGCKHGGGGSAEANPVGNYALVSVDGKPVPCTIEHDGHSIAIKSGAFVISLDGTCVSKMVFSPPSGDTATREVKATYTQAGSTLTMRWEGAGVTTGNVQGSTFTMNNEGMVLAYRK